MKAKAKKLSLTELEKLISQNSCYKQIPNCKTCATLDHCIFTAKKIAAAINANYVTTPRNSPGNTKTK